MAQRSYDALTKAAWKNPKYKGYFCCNKVGTEDMFTKKMVFKPESEWVMFKDERIVPAI